MCEVELNELLSGTALFEILTTTHKAIISQEYQIASILDQGSNDLYIFLGTEEMKALKKETYNMRVTLKTAEHEYVVFAENKIKYALKMKELTHNGQHMIFKVKGKKVDVVADKLMKLENVQSACLAWEGEN